MIEIKSGDVFECGASAIVIPVNCVGVMGKGLALEAKQRFPVQSEAYFQTCRNRELRPGGVFASPRAEPGEPRLLFAATKNHWRNPSELHWVSDCGLFLLAELRRIRPEGPVAVPALGCGNGGLPWPPVRDILLMELGSYEGLIFLFAPS